MRAKRKNDKKSNSKSLEKRSTSKRQEVNFFLDYDLGVNDKSKVFVPDTFESKTREARSQQGSRRGEKK